jgi:hypothetical protein
MPDWHILGSDLLFFVEKRVTWKILLQKMSKKVAPRDTKQLFERILSVEQIVPSTV